MHHNTERFLNSTIEKIGGLSNSDYCLEDEGMLDEQARRKVFARLENDAGPDHRLVIARLATLCAQATRSYLRTQDTEALALLDVLSTHVDGGDLSGLQSVEKRAHTMFMDADRSQETKFQTVTIKDEPNQQSLLARATVAQAIKLATGGIPDDDINAYIRKVNPDVWMPEMWAACTVANGLPQFEHSTSHKMRHFWMWYLTVAIPLALDLEHPTTDPRFDPPPEQPPAHLKRYTCHWANSPTGDPNITRRAFLHGYVEKVVNNRGRTTQMRFMHNGNSCGKFWVDYQARRGTYADEQYGGINYQSGTVEEVHLSHLAASQDNVPIDDWVAEMEATVLRDVLSSRFQWFFEWADRHWETPFEPALHRDDLRVCMDSIEWVFEASNITLEEARPYHQIMWCFCAFALDEQVDRANTLFRKAWKEDGELMRGVKDTIMAVADRHR